MHNRADRHGVQPQRRGCRFHSPPPGSPRYHPARWRERGNCQYCAGENRRSHQKVQGEAVDRCQKCAAIITSFLLEDRERDSHEYCFGISCFPCFPPSGLPSSIQSCYDLCHVLVLPILQVYKSSSRFVGLPSTICLFTKIRLT